MLKVYKKTNMFIINENELLKEVKNKPSSSFLKFDDGNNRLILLSHSGNLFSHFVKDRGSIACIGKDCEFCKKGMRRKREIFYVAELNGKKGFLRIPLTVFIAILDIVASGAFEKLKTPRQACWLVIKKGKGRNTRYTVNFANMIEEDTKKIKENTDELKKFLEKYWENLKKKYEEIQDEEQEVENKEEEKIDPDDIPF